MMPMYMDSSNLRHMRPQGAPYYQGFGNNPQHMAMDVPSPVPYGSWPAPSQCYGSCIPPAYNTYWPYYPPQLPHHPCCVNHSGFHPFHHASHAPPCHSYPPWPLGYQPRFDYEKDGPGKHFCLNCNPKADGGIVIEEQEPEKEKGKNGEAVDPVRSTGYPYPIIWIPRENAKNQGQGNGSQKEAPGENMKIQKSEPKSWNGYFPLDESTMKSFAKDQDGQKKLSGKTVEIPFDISKLKSLLQGQDGKDVENQQNNEASGQFPYPIIWIPSHGKPEEGKERVDVEASEGHVHGDKKSFPSDNHVNNARHGGKEGNSEGKVCSDKEERRSVRNIPVRLSEDHSQTPTEPTKEKSSSPPKASKLPPVCLRVDPLPSKKRTGCSKSLSPPRRKEEPLTSEERKRPSPRSSKEAETKTIPLSCNVQSEEKKQLNAAEREKKTVENNTKMQEGANTEVVKPHEPKGNGEKLVKVSFTEEEAAKTIQCMYRGYDVRRRESLKKLKQIAKIREKMSDVKKRIQTLELSTDQNIEGKEFIAVGEMVMSLILELDSIQGLHPSIRDFRKSLARELLDMQESIDSLKKKRTLVEKEALSKPVEDLKPATEADGCEVDVAKPTVSEKVEEVETVVPVTPSSGDGKGKIEINSEKDGAMEESLESPHGLAQESESQTDGVCSVKGFERQETETKVSDDENETTVTDTSLPSENDAHHSSPSGVKIEEAEDPLDSGVQVPPCACESVDPSPELLPQDAETRAFSIQLPEEEVEQRKEEEHHADVEDAIVNESEVIDRTNDLQNITENIDGTCELSKAGAADMDYSDHITGSGQETTEPEEQTEQTSEIEVYKYELDEADAAATDIETHDQETSIDHSKDISQETAPEREVREIELCEADTRVIDPETESQETEADYSTDQSKGADQNDDEPKLPETEVTGQEISEESKKLMEENQRLRETMEKLVTAGSEQLGIISNLTGRVKSLEKKLSQRKKTQVKRHRTCRTKPTSKPKSNKSIPSASVL